MGFLSNILQTGTTLVSSAFNTASSLVGGVLGTVTNVVGSLGNTATNVTNSTGFNSLASNPALVGGISSVLTGGTTTGTGGFDISGILTGLSGATQQQQPKQQLWDTTNVDTGTNKNVVWLALGGLVVLLVAFFAFSKTKK